MEKKLYELNINEKFEHLIPPLSEGEYALLTEQIVEEGCRDALVVWKGTIVDGHNRYRICHEHGIPFSVEEMDFEDEAAAQFWILKNQLGRRNLTAYQRIEAVIPFEEMVKAEAKKRQIRKKKGDFVVQNLAPQKGKARDELARLAGVSHGLYDMAKKVYKDADEETKIAVRNGEVSIYAAFKGLKEKENMVNLNTPAPLPEPDPQEEETAEDDFPETPQHVEGPV